LSGAVQLRAPTEDGAVVAQPPFDQVPRLLADNRNRLATLSHPFYNSEARRRARHEAVETARDYLEQAGEPVPPPGDSHSLILAGHQPELFHPGVWVKNFAAHGIARRHGATALNLIVDSDTVKATTLRLPGWQRGFGPGHARVRTLPFDRWAGEVPYEERPILDASLFESLPQRAADVVQEWNFKPLLPEFWAEVRRQTRRAPLLGECFAAARRTFERRWGCHNLEVPVSRLCQTRSFARFACHLIAHLAGFHELYNAVVEHYRRQHGIRSRNHPVPDLAREGDWLEAPFWAWRHELPHRQRLLARVTSSAVHLRAGKESVALDLSGDLDDLAAQWLALQQHGLRIRSRALTTTMYARLFLADLFIHGIGGGKYDELTDDIIRRFYGVEPPGFLVLSATLLLPFPRFPVTEEACRSLERLQRDLIYNPQRHAVHFDPPDDTATQLVREKQAWMERTLPGSEQGRRRHEKLKSLTAQLHPYVATAQQSLQRQVLDCRAQLAANAVLARRDYPFCLYPEEPLRSLCERFAVP
jgi:hypothetical protein